MSTHSGDNVAHYFKALKSPGTRAITRIHSHLCDSVGKDDLVVFYLDTKSASSINII